jgi:multiple sugar transport system substrate-binding protein
VAGSHPQTANSQLKLNLDEYRVFDTRYSIGTRYLRNQRVEPIKERTMNQQKLSRRGFLRISGVGAASALLAACVAPGSPQGAADAPSAGDDAAAPAAAGKEVRFATDWVEGARGATIETAMPIWSERYPDTTITLEPIGGDYFDRLQIQFSGGTVADVILFEGVLGAEYIAEGLIADLAPTLQAEDIDQSKWRPGVPDIFKQGDKVYAMPFQLTPVIWFYNRTLFQEKGVAEPDGTWDWARTLEAAQQLTEPPNTYGYWTRVDMFHQYGAMGLSNSDHHWVNDEFTETLVGEPGFADAIRWTIETVQTHQVSPLPSEVEGLLTAGVTNLFASGKIGMHSANAGGIGSFYDSIGDRFEWDIMPTPKAPLTGRGGGLWNDQPHVVTSNAIQREVLTEATQLVVFLASDEVQTIIATDRGSTPTVQAIQESETYLSAPPNNMQVVIDELEEMVGPRFFPSFLEWFNTLNKEYELGLIGERGVDETIEAMVIEGDKVLANIPR